MNLNASDISRRRATEARFDRTVDLAWRAFVTTGVLGALVLVGILFA